MDSKTFQVNDRLHFGNPSSQQELTRFIIIIILGLLFSTIRPVQAAGQVFALQLAFDSGYSSWSDKIHLVGTGMSQIEVRRMTGIQKVLAEQTGVAQEPPEWIHTNITEGTDWTNFIMRSDNYYLLACQNKYATHSVSDATHFFPGSINIGFGGAYKDLNGERKNLTNLNLNQKDALKGLRTLSQYRHGVSDLYAMKLEWTRYTLMLGEGQRFTEVDECIKKGWLTVGCHITNPDELLVSWNILSCGILEKWNPKTATRKKGTDPIRKKTYTKTLSSLGITEAQAPGLLRVLVLGKACKDNTKDVFCAGKPCSFP